MNNWQITLNINLDTLREGQSTSKHKSSFKNVFIQHVSTLVLTAPTHY